MIDKQGHIGIFEIVTHNLKSGKIKQEEIHNRIMNASLNTLAGVLAGTVPDLEIKYLALGTDNTPITDLDTQLGAEIFRTQPTIDPALVSTGRIETTFTILDNEAVGAIKEIGIFGGSTATSTPNSGTLIARVLWDKTKSSSEEITIKRIDKVVRA